MPTLDILWECVFSNPGPPADGVDNSSANGSQLTGLLIGPFRPDRDVQSLLLTPGNYQGAATDLSGPIATTMPAGAQPIAGNRVAGTVTVPEGGGWQLNLGRTGPNGGSWSSQVVSPLCYLKSVIQDGRAYTLVARGTLNTSFSTALSGLQISKFEFDFGGQVFTIPAQDSAVVSGVTETYATCTHTVTGANGAPIRVRAVASSGTYSAWCRVKLPPCAPAKITVDPDDEVYEFQVLDYFSPDATATVFALQNGLPAEQLYADEPSRIVVNDLRPGVADLPAEQRPDPYKIDAVYGLPHFQIDLRRFVLNVNEFSTCAITVQAVDSDNVSNGNGGTTGEAYTYRYTTRRSAGFSDEHGLGVVARLVVMPGAVRVSDAPFPPPLGVTQTPFSAYTQVEVSRLNLQTFAPVTGDPFVIPYASRPFLFAGPRGAIYLGALQLNGPNLARSDFFLWRTFNGQDWEQVLKENSTPVVMWLNNSPAWLNGCRIPGGGIVTVGVAANGLSSQISYDGQTWPTGAFSISNTVTRSEPYFVIYRNGRLYVTNGRSGGERRVFASNGRLGIDWIEVTADTP